MKREILFKAKRIDNGEWIKGYYSKDEETDQVYIEDIDYHHQPKEEVDPESVCQFTGLFDKNANRIYENDILTNGITERFVTWTGIGWGLKKRESNTFIILPEEEYAELHLLGNIHD